MRLSGKRIREFQDMILAWWSHNRRDLPWRHTRDPYRIMISEMMLQQTQVARVIPKYEAFILAFPDIGSLSRSKTSDVLRLWQGLGYNRRALYVKRTAEMVMSEHGGTFPRAEKELVQLPGMGKYTARAILVFAYELPVPLVDTNIRKIIMHYFLNDISHPDTKVEEIAAALIPQGQSWQWHQALMDYGAIELSQILPRAAKKGGIPFTSTDRFYRGRIVDTLRQGPVKTRELLDAYTATYGKDAHELSDVVGKLVSDGLIVRRGNRLSLPD